MKRSGTTLKGNDYRFLGAPDPGSWTPELTVSVVIPAYQGQAELERTLAALGRQTYPSDLLEVLVVDDGSDPPITLPGFPGRIRLLRQPRDGFGLARARNLGAREAAGGILCFLDCDMIPGRRWAEAHARWHHLADDIVTVGTRSHVEVEGVGPDAVQDADDPAALFEGQDLSMPPWIDAHLRRTDDLLRDEGDLFRVTSGGNLGVSKPFYESIGGYDETFTQWGGEDIDFGYRAYTAGAVIVPERAAHAYHQGPGADPDPTEAASLHEQRAKLAHLVAHPDFRSVVPGRSYSVPMVTVAIDGGDLDAAVVAAQVESVLASDHHDLVVSVRTDGVDGGEWLRRQFAGDPRVVLDEEPERTHPFAAFRMELPPGLEIGDKVVRRLVHAAATTGVVEVATSHGVVRVGRTRALSRVGSDSPSRWEDAAAVFGSKEMRASDFHLSAAGSPWRDRLPPKARKVADRVEGIRSWDDFVGTMQWLFAGLAAVLRLKRRRIGVVGMSRSGLPRLPLPGIHSTGGEGFARLPRLMGMRADLVYGRTAPSRKAMDAITALGGTWLQLPDEPTHLAVPPFDPLRFNPIGWRAEHSGNDRRYRRIPDARPGLRSHRSVVIPAPGSAADAARVARLAGLGVVLAAHGDGPWEEWLGPDLAAAITEPHDLDDPNERELASVRQRRAAHAHHSEHARRTQLLGAAGLPDMGATRVSVVLATNRPEYVDHALREVAKQTHRPLEVIVGLHGDGFGEVDGSLPGDIPLTVVRADGDTVFGDLLDLLTARATGDLIAKMDDDDHYGPHHLTDLVVAARYSDAALVGKGAEFIHLQSTDRTVRRVAGEPETGSRTIAGGAMAIHRRALNEVGGWARVHRGVDQTLITAVKERGLTIHRTHGFGYVLERRPSGHTWAADDAYFDRDAVGQWDGLETDVSDVGPRNLR